MVLGVLAFEFEAADVLPAAAAAAAAVVNVDALLGEGEYKGGGVLDDEEEATPLPFRRNAVVPWAVLQGIRGVPPSDKKNTLNENYFNYYYYQVFNLRMYIYIYLIIKNRIKPQNMLKTKEV